jgi:hypothetical protein
MNENAFKNFKSNRPDITGSSTINHAVRVKLQLNCSHYCYMKYISDCFESKKVIEQMEVYEAIGFDATQQNFMVKELMLSGFLYINEKTDRVMMTGKWGTGFPNIEAEFDRFWKKDGKVAWSGSRAQALMLYQKVVKSKNVSVILAQRDSYFEYLETEHKRGFNRSAMAAERWLNPKAEHYMEDYQAYILKLKAEYPGIFETMSESPKAATITGEDIIKAYE